MQYVLIALGGAAGAVSRFAIGSWVVETFGRSKLPFATLSVNLVGCLLIGILFRLGQSVEFLDKDLRPLVFVGFLGGFTTFSTFGLEMLVLLRDHGPPSVLLYAFLSVAGGLLLTWAGYALCHLWAPSL